MAHHDIMDTRYTLMGDEDTSPKYKTKYKDDCPEDIALIIVGPGGLAMCLEHMGPGIDFVMEEGLFDPEDECFTAHPGVYIWRGKLVQLRTPEEDGGGELVSTVMSRATEDQWRAYLDNSWPWDPEPYLKTEPKDGG